jgi:hypothetical protein
MIDLQFDIQIEGEEADDPIIEDYGEMIEHTKAQMRRHVERSLDGMRCPEHDQPPQVLISGTYSLDTEQLEVAYNVDTCCRTFLMQAIAALNRR